MEVDEISINIREILKGYQVSEKILSGLEGNSVRTRKKAYLALRKFMDKIDYDSQYEMSYPYYESPRNSEIDEWEFKKYYYKTTKVYRDLMKLYQIKGQLFHKISPSDIRDMLKCGTMSLVYEECLETHKRIDKLRVLELEKVILGEIKSYLITNGFSSNLEYVERYLKSDSKIFKFTRI